MKLTDLKTKETVTNNPTVRGGKPRKRTHNFYVCNKCRGTKIYTVFGHKDYSHVCQSCGEKYQ